MEKNVELANKIKDKLQKRHIISIEYVDGFVERIFDMCSQELEPNVWEWVEDKPYIDIKYIGLSINDLINLGYNKKFFQISKCFKRTCQYRFY